MVLMTNVFECSLVPRCKQGIVIQADQASLVRTLCCTSAHQAGALNESKQHDIPVAAICQTLLEDLGHPCRQVLLGLV